MAPLAAQNDKNRSRQGRIPATLQAVFLASNRGRDVNKPPPQKVASKVYFRNWLFQRQAGSKEKGKSLFGGSNRKAQKKETITKNVPKIVVHKKTAIPSLSPQVYLDAMIRSQGYSTKKFQTLQSAYYNKPTPLQIASYDLHLIDTVKAFDNDKLAAMISAGLSPNPCNTYGETLVHMVCRRGDAKALKIFLDNGASLQIADDYGRTPLHDCCWAANPAFDVADQLLDTDIRFLYMMDARGSLPLSYVRKELWAAWIEYLEAKKDVYWPKRKLKKDGEEAAPPLTLLGPNTRPLADPSNALTLQLAKMVSAGKMQPDEAQMLKYDKADELTVESSEYDSEEDDDDSEYDSDYDSEDEYSLDDGEMADILNSMPASLAAH